MRSGYRWAGVRIRAHRLIQSATFQASFTNCAKAVAMATASALTSALLFCIISEIFKERTHVSAGASALHILCQSLSRRSDCDASVCLGQGHLHCSGMVCTPSAVVCANHCWGTTCRSMRAGRKATLAFTEFTLWPQPGPGPQRSRRKAKGKRRRRRRRASCMA